MIIFLNTFDTTNQSFFESVASILLQVLRREQKGVLHFVIREANWSDLSKGCLNGKVMETGEQLGPFSDVQKKPSGFLDSKKHGGFVGVDLGWGICPATHWIPCMPCPFRSNIFHQGFVFGVSESLRGLTHPELSRIQKKFDIFQLHMLHISRLHVSLRTSKVSIWIDCASPAK